MKTQDIKSPQDLTDYIEGIFNDFESGLSSKQESSKLVVDLILKCAKAEKEGKRITEIDDNYFLKVDFLKKSKTVTVGKSPL